MRLGSNRDTDLTIEEKDDALGFSDAVNFRHTFRRWSRVNAASAQRNFPGCRLSGGSIAGLELAGRDRIHHIFAGPARSCTMAGLGTLGDLLRVATSAKSSANVKRMGDSNSEICSQRGSIRTAFGDNGVVVARKGYAQGAEERRGYRSLIIST
jgi:hypothetical protein